MLCLNVPMAAAGTERGIYLLTGSVYVHVPDGPSYTALSAQGVKTAEVSWAMHAALLAAHVAA